MSEPWRYHFSRSIREYRDERQTEQRNEDHGRPHWIANFMTKVIMGGSQVGKWQRTATGAGS